MIAAPALSCWGRRVAENPPSRCVTRWLRRARGCAAVFAFDETLATLVGRAKGLGLNVKQHVESGKLILRQVDAAELSPGQFVHEIRKLVEEHDLKLVIIDSLNGFLNAMPGEKFLAMQLHELLGYLATKA